MGMGFRLIVGGIVCVIISIGWTLDAANNGELSKIIEGSIWKGPLLVPLFNVKPLCAWMFAEQGCFTGKLFNNAAKAYSAKPMSAGKALWRRKTALLIKAKPLAVTR
jgi:hypothetical protein